MNTQTQEALKMAIEYLEEIHVGNMTPMAETNWNKAIQACKEALAQPAQEPYGWELFFNNGQHNRFTTNKGEAAEYGENKIPLYTHPAPSWQGLSDDEVGTLIAPYEYDVHPDLDGLTRAVEQALKEKNT